MRITVIGTGYVGLVAGVCLAEMGNEVICIDNNSDKIEILKRGEIPIYEPGLEQLITKNTKERRLIFSTDTDSAVKNSEICFIAVGTPQSEDGSADLQYVFEAAKSIAKSMNGYKVIVNKSTVPVGTADIVKKFISENTSYDFDVVSNPEFLRQGNAVKDFLEPDRIIIGSDSDKATMIIKNLYSPLTDNGIKIIIMDIKSAEMTKYAANSFLATKISFMNEIANLCEKLGADAEMVRLGISSDERIGNKFLYPGIGYGGSCFPKDTRALINLAKNNDCEMKIIKATDFVNSNQVKLFIQKIINRFGNDMRNLTFSIWGLAFKPNTNDMREAPSIAIINTLLSMGAKIKAYDPKAMPSAKKILKDISYCDSAYDAAENTDALLILTEWKEFGETDLLKLKSLIKNPVIFDGRNIFRHIKIENAGFEYHCIGNGRAKTNTKELHCEKVS